MGEVSSARGQHDHSSTPQHVSSDAASVSSGCYYWWLASDWTPLISHRCLIIGPSPETTTDNRSAPSPSIGLTRGVSLYTVVHTPPL